ncbi:MAG: right-handed parallel beta-helix repeat-containing protein [Ruminococcaceae bacterium]|nr:right-handed parallel beta-helix repeat-containing protein [Oscillospiraceae bacterium]
MKKIIALILVLCMSLGMIVSVSAEGPFIQRLSLARLIRLMFASDDNGYGIGEVKDGVLTVYVAVNGKNDADGTKKNPYATITAARDAIRDIDRAGLSGIDIYVTAGVYSITEPVSFDEEDGGSKNCPVRIIGEDGAQIVGGAAFTKDAFTKAEGEITEYFPQPDKIVMLDLTKYNYSVEMIGELLANRDYQAVAPAFSADGVLQTLARYPNESEGWINITEGWMLDKNGNVTPYTDNDVGRDHEQFPVQTKIQYGEAHMERVQSWHSADGIKIAARFNQLWCSDNSYITSISQDEDIFYIPYTGGYEPLAGTVMYWYNIPEELDAPGEFYITADGKLYYYPTDSFETAVFSLPLSDGIFNINADYVTIENLKFESSRANGLNINGDNVTITDCEISAIAGECAIKAEGNNILIKNNSIHDCRKTAVTVETGNIETLERGNALITNNEIYNFGLNSWPYTYGIHTGGCGSTVSHNDIHDSKTRAIYWTGAYHTIEYNDVHDVLTAADDIGAISSDHRINVGNVIRYNYIHNIGCVGALAEIDKINPDYSYLGCAAIYGDFGGSYWEAYGNVIEHINGNGFQVGGRDIIMRGNLIIDCTNWYVWITAMQYDDAYKYNKNYAYSVPDYVYTDVWKEANPDLASVKTDLREVAADDSMGWAMPVGNVVQNNWIHYNRGDRDQTQWGVAPYYIYAEVFMFSADTIDVKQSDRSNKNMSSYNSRRQTYDLKELITTTAAGVIEITWGQFEQIGRYED